VVVSSVEIVVISVVVEVVGSTTSQGSGAGGLLITAEHKF
jgi:hypothetical protein